MSKAYALKHAGIAVKDADKMARWMIDNLGADYIRKKPVPADGMHSTYIRLGEQELEIMEPDEEGVGTIGTFIAKRGEGLHHISLAVDDATAMEQELEAKGMRLMAKGTVEGHKGFFIHPKECGILIEIFEYSQVAQREENEFVVPEEFRK